MGDYTPRARWLLRLEYGGMRFENDVANIAEIGPVRNRMVERHGIGILTPRSDGRLTGRVALTGATATFTLIHRSDRGA